ncbi:cation-translocating P-type ATPase [Devosia sp.]|uniref:cation-translocating P-type ATPase n=1 Tax=Devosia sp. TaxID=1871048 RepID=UPI0032638F3A
MSKVTILAHNGRPGPEEALMGGGENWHTRSGAEALLALHSVTDGLSTSEAARRLEIEGENKIAGGNGPNPFGIFLAQFTSLMIWVLIAAGALSGIMGQLTDALAIMAVVLLHALVGFYQEYSAENSIAALKKLTSPQAKVKRGGVVLAIPASAVVSGDILVLEAGDLVAADARLLSASSITCSEAALTGESGVVEKHAAKLERSGIPLAERSNMIFMGTAIASGSGRAVVVGTAMNTQLGRIAALIQRADARAATPLQKKLDAVGRMLVWATLGIVVTLFLLGLWRGTPLLELVLTSVSLAVAAVPEGLPAVVTVALSIGVTRMARRGALVRRLSAVETLGSTNVICTDKTGTLTVGEMTVKALYVAGQAYEVTGEGYGSDGRVLLAGSDPARGQRAALLMLGTALVGCNNAHIASHSGLSTLVGDPTEGALLAAGIKAGADRANIDVTMPQLRELPFDSDRKRSAVVRKVSDDLCRVLINGAPGPLLALSTHIFGRNGVQALSDEDRVAIRSEISGMAKQGLRVLGSAYRDVTLILAETGNVAALERELVFVGLAGMYDPPRTEAKLSIAKCRDAGIRVIMITGDHPETASAIASEVGIVSATAPMTGENLDGMSDEKLAVIAPEIAVYARVTAEHKFRIVRALQVGGKNVVAMTGDGVNDAPAIKGADIGIAMGKSGTEVTRQAADVILVDDNFQTIVAAVEQGRGIYDNIRKTLQYLLAGNAGELMLMGVCVFAGLPAPLLPIHLLWINLVTDGLPALCLAGDPIDKDVMKRGPRPNSENIMDASFLIGMMITGMLTGGVALAVYVVTLQSHPVAVARTYAFTVLVFAELLRAFGARSTIRPVWQIALFTNRNLVFVVALSVGLQVWSQHNDILGTFLKSTSVPAADCLGLLLAGCVPLAAIELIKVVRGWPRRGKPLVS